MWDIFIEKFNELFKNIDVLEVDISDSKKLRIKLLDEKMTEFINNGFLDENYQDDDEPSFFSQEERLFYHEKFLSLKSKEYSLSEEEFYNKFDSSLKFTDNEIYNDNYYETTLKFTDSVRPINAHKFRKSLSNQDFIVTDDLSNLTYKLTLYPSFEYLVGKISKSKTFRAINKVDIIEFFYEAEETDIFEYILRDVTMTNGYRNTFLFKLNQIKKGI